VIDLGLGRKDEAFGEIESMAEGMSFFGRAVFRFGWNGAIRKCCTYPSAYAGIDIRNTGTQALYATAPTSLSSLSKSFVPPCNFHSLLRCFVPSRCICALALVLCVRYTGEFSYPCLTCAHDMQDMALQ